MTTDLRKTPLHGWHVRQKARMADFAGWSMPIQYSTIVEEHLATRSSVTLFDVSHMARFRFEGAGTAEFLDSLLTRRVSDMQEGDIRYSLATNDSGGVLDDLLVYNVNGVLGEQYYGMVANASNRQKLLDWIAPRLASRAVSFTDETDASAMIAVQGPKAALVVDQIINGVVPSDLRYYTNSTAKIKDTEISALVSRTGYTGEDGFEIVVSVDWANRVWDRLLSVGEEFTIRAAGLGARDTLRLEAGMPLYGHELSETMNPLQAGLGFAINPEGRMFPGSDKFAVFDVNSHPKLIGLKLGGKRVPRENYTILNSDREEIGHVSSGTFSPTLQVPIAMAFVKADFANTGTELFVDIRGKNEPAIVSKLPFYRRKKG